MALKRLKPPVILNSAGKPIVLNQKEQATANYWQRVLNARFGNSLGYEVSITTLTTIVKKISQQKFFEVAPADFLPIKVGEGTWSSNLTTYRSFQSADQFESGMINTGSDNTRLSTADAGVDALNIKINNWAKAIGWNIFDLELAAKSGNWDLVAEKERARKTNWDLGIQRVAFLGARGQNGLGGSCLGLLNQPGVTVDTTTITTALSLMTYTQLAAFQQAVIGKYRANNNYTAFPTHFIIPELDYNGLVAQSSPPVPAQVHVAAFGGGVPGYLPEQEFQNSALGLCEYGQRGRRAQRRFRYRDLHAPQVRRDLGPHGHPARLHQHPRKLPGQFHVPECGLWAVHGRPRLPAS